MTCQYFGICGSCKLYELSYEEQIAQKKETIREQFEPLGIEDFEFFASKESHYRARAEFRIWHTNERIDYGMHKMQGHGIVTIKECPKVDAQIFDMMPRLLAYLQDHELLKRKLYAIEFLSTSQSLLVTLIYHRPIDEAWEQEAKACAQTLHINIVGRSKKIKKIIGNDFVMEHLQIFDETYRYQILEGGFSQPNTTINQKMIEWVLNAVHSSRDLLELYCGHGNFTMPLSQKFDKVLATEISKTSINAALTNCELNGIDSIQFVRMSVEELTAALQKEREFYRLKNVHLDDYDFSHVFVDPPRAGIDEKSLQFISQFENIIYISCNPLTLKRDLLILTKTFDVVKFAVFDQFPYTNHIESGIILRRKQTLTNS
ncbi:tRNA (uridine(54)-C5)-methyltransferase TrmA [Sulfurospirillum sp. 1612]|uniref:tRNA (uridine(54)-C5)-methyltransferase TrmA n=1 Tax=Sulfurospirillum sp. 1612 TaxID=3094835 RepID=UPI002F94185B